MSEEIKLIEKDFETLYDIVNGYRNYNISAFKSSVFFKNSLTMENLLFSNKETLAKLEEAYSQIEELKNEIEELQIEIENIKED